MPRPKIGENQRRTAYRLHKRGFGPSHIRRELVGEFGDLEEPASERTIKYWVKKFKAINDDITKLDSPFQWHKLDQYGLPWESSRFLMDMLRLIQSHNIDINCSNDQLPPDATSKSTGIPDATLREVLWWWRVHQAAPEIGVTVGELDDVRVIANQFAIRGLTSDLLGELVDVTDLEALLVHQPWLDEERRTTYNNATEMGLAPSVRGSLTIDQALRLNPNVADDLILDPATIDSNWNGGFSDGLLPSQWRAELKRVKELHRAHRETRDHAEEALGREAE